MLCLWKNADVPGAFAQSGTPLRVAFFQVAREARREKRSGNPNIIMTTREQE
jgi:hypothetical protein